MADYPVKFFDSSMLGHPVLNGTVGTMANILKKCLIQGFSEVSVTSINVQSDVATVVTSVPHGFDLAGGTGGLGPIIAISGATPASLNSEWRVLTTDGNMTFTIGTTGVPDGAATGTILVKRAPLGWQNPYSGTNKEVFRPKVGYCQQYLRVLDDSTVATSAAGRWGTFIGFETMTGIDDLSGNRFPTTSQFSNGLQVAKSTTSDTSERQWYLVGDGGIFYFGTFWSPSYVTHASMHVFGDFESLRPSDEYNCIVIGGLIASLASHPGQTSYFEFSILGAVSATQSGKYIARPWNQSGTSVAAGMMGDNTISTSMGYGGLAFPYPINNGLLFSQVSVVESSTIRSRAMPGMYQPLHSNPFVHLDVILDVPDAPDKIFRAYNLGNSNNQAQCLIDIKGPWRP